MQNKDFSETLHIEGMTCANCERAISRGLMRLDGVHECRVDYAKGTAQVRYDAQKVSHEAIDSALRKLGYSLQTGAKKPPAWGRAALYVLVIVLAYMGLERTGLLLAFSNLPLAEEGMGYGMLFIIGLLTSVHCLAMCGGINLSQTLGKKESVRSSFLYNAGRVVSYTIVGGLVGTLGAVFTLTGIMRGVVQGIAGVFMVIMGLNMLGLFPFLRKLQPKMPRIFGKLFAGRAAGHGAFVVGLLNGLMPCGPLQAMQIYALSTGDPLRGALSMFLFSLGTVPLMFGLGALSSLMSQKFSKQVMAVGAVLVVVLGISMLGNGLSLSGISMPGQVPSTQKAAVTAGPSGGNADIQEVRTLLLPGRYEPITVKAGTPVRWVINAPKGSINGCNNRIFVPEYDIEHAFTYGDNVIEFTPTETGTFPFSCWMGMIRSSITVTDA